MEIGIPQSIKNKSCVHFLQAFHRISGLAKVHRIWFWTWCYYSLWKFNFEYVKAGMPVGNILMVITYTAEYVYSLLMRFW